jgi:hypothetical protein
MLDICYSRPVPPKRRARLASTSERKRLMCVRCGSDRVRIALIVHRHSSRQQEGSRKRYNRVSRLTEARP